MAVHPDFPRSPYEVLNPDQRWFPADEALRTTSQDKLLPPLVDRIRREVAAWRESGYSGASPTSRALLSWWFEREHYVAGADGRETLFRYYFAQRESVESVIWLHDVRKVRDKFDLLRFDASGRVSAGMFDEEWPRYVIKMATGSGKTKVLSLLLAWSYFHRLYEPDSPLARNFLVIAPNIIVLDRLRQDFDGLRIYFKDPILPDNGYEGRNWHDDFQVTLHVQDEVRVVRPTGNIFLTNIHRVFLGDAREPSLEDDDLRDYFLAPFGPKPVGKTTDSRTDLGEVVREIDELVVFNDEAHHIHDARLAWFKSIQDIHHLHAGASPRSRRRGSGPRRGDREAGRRQGPWGAVGVLRAKRSRRSGSSRPGRGATTARRSRGGEGSVARGAEGPPRRLRRPDRLRAAPRRGSRAPGRAWALRRSCRQGL